VKDLIKKDSHFLHMSDEEKANFRWVKAVEGFVLIALCIKPDMPVLNRLSLFIIYKGSPFFLEYIYQETWDDDSWLSNLLYQRGFI